MEKIEQIKPEPKSANEEFYERDCSKVLGLIAEMCRVRGIAFIAALEYDPGATAVVGTLPAAPSMAMTMLTHCANATEDFDGYARGLVAWMDQQGIDYTHSPCLLAISRLPE